jgi:hypothetical protein
MTKKRLFISILVSAALAMPMGGFVFGITTTKGSPESIPLSGKIWLGSVYAILTTISLGFPPEALEDQAQSYNVWPYITICGLIIFGICTAFAYLKSRRKSPS